MTCLNGTFNIIQRLSETGEKGLKYRVLPLHGLPTIATQGVKENEYARDSGPKVTIHTSRGAFDAQEDGSATAYIINGPETNVAAGSGLRGIRWLRGP